MSKYINMLRQLVREEMSMLEDKQGRKSKGLVIANAEKAAKVKRLYPEDHWIHLMIASIEETGDRGLTRLGYRDPSNGEFVNGLAQILDMNNTKFGPQVKELISSGVLLDKEETAIPKKVKPETTGRRGRPRREVGEGMALHEVFRRLHKK